MTGRIQRNRRFRGTRLSPGKSSVLYLCRADGSRSCITPRKVWLQLRRSGGKGCPLRGSVSDRKKAGKRCGYALSASPVICGTKVYQSPRQPLLSIVLKPPRQLPTQAVHRLTLHLLCPALAQMKMERRAARRGDGKRWAAARAVSERF